jgi:RNA-directed DNA polymerase
VKRLERLRDGAEILDFLGYRFRYEKDRKGRPWRYLSLFPSKKSLEKEREKIRELTSPKQCCKPVSKVIEELNEHLAGWKNYYKVGYCRREFRQINYFLQRRMIKHLRRRSQRGYKFPERGQCL